MESPKKLQLVPKGKYKCENNPEIDRGQNAGTPTRSPFPRGKSENDLDIGRRLSAEVTKKSPASAAKHFMVPTISAASKVNHSKKKILGERNEVTSTQSVKGSIPRSKSFSYEQIEESETESVKPRNSIDSTETPRAKFLRYIPERRSELILNRETEAAESKKSAVVHSGSKSSSIDDSSSYDPVTNYLSPRPKFLWYDPDRSRERLARNNSSVSMLLGCDNETLEDDSDGSSCSTLGSVYEEEASRAETADNDVEARNESDRDMVETVDRSKGDEMANDGTDGKFIDFKKDDEKHTEIHELNVSQSGDGKEGNAKGQSEFEDVNKLEDSVIEVDNGIGSLFDKCDDKVMKSSPDVDESDCECEDEEESHGRGFRKLVKFVLLVLVLAISCSYILKANTVPSTPFLETDNNLAGQFWFEDILEDDKTADLNSGIAEENWTSRLLDCEHSDYIDVVRSLDGTEARLITGYEESREAIEERHSFEILDFQSLPIDSVEELENNSPHFGTEAVSDDVIGANDDANGDDISKEADEDVQDNSNLEYEVLSDDLIRDHDVVEAAEELQDQSIVEAVSEIPEYSSGSLEPEVVTSGHLISVNDVLGPAEDEVVTDKLDVTEPPVVEGNEIDGTEPTEENHVFGNEEARYSVLENSIDVVTSHDHDEEAITGATKMFSLKILSIIVGGVSAVLAVSKAVLRLGRNRNVVSSSTQVQNAKKLPGSLQNLGREPAAQLGDVFWSYGRDGKTNMKAHSVPILLQPTVSAISGTHIISESASEVISSRKRVGAGTHSHTPSRRSNRLRNQDEGKISEESICTDETPSLRRSTRIRNRGVLSP